MKLTRTVIGALLPNPHRNMDTYPLNAEKLSALMDSMKETGMWPNIMARPHGNHYQIAYGHHRLAAAKAAFGDDYSVFIVVDDFDDLQMLRLMARENLEAYATDFRTLMETFEATVMMASKGLIPAIPATKSDNAAKYKNVSDATLFTYDVVNVASFLGWMTSDGKGGSGTRTAYSARASAMALELIGDGRMTREQFIGLSTTAAFELTSAVVSQMRTVQKAATMAKAALPVPTEAAKRAVDAKAEKQTKVIVDAAATVAAGVAAGEIPTTGVRTAVSEKTYTHKETSEVFASGYIAHTRNRVNKVFDKGSDMMVRFETIIEAAPMLEDRDKREGTLLAGALDGMSADSQAMATRVRNAMTATKEKVIPMKAIEGGAK
jgi:ParB-like nuclease domain